MTRKSCSVIFIDNFNQRLKASFNSLLSSSNPGFTKRATYFSLSFKHTGGEWVKMSVSSNQKTRIASFKEVKHIKCEFVYVQANVTIIVWNILRQCEQKTPSAAFVTKSNIFTLPSTKSIKRQRQVLRMLNVLRGFSIRIAVSKQYVFLLESNFPNEVMVCLSKLAEGLGLNSFWVFPF
ncbi:hypothetical protein N42HA_00264 [Lactococcus lactis]|nr:hypothetical protein [Lactococcus lactis]